MNRSEAQSLKRSLENLLSPVERLQILVDLESGVSETELERRYSNFEKSVEYLCECGLVYNVQDEYQLSDIGEKYADILVGLQDTAERRQRLEPLFEADPSWATILPPTSVLQAGTVVADYSYSSETEMEYLDLLEGSSTIQILNPLPDYSRALLDALSGSDDALLQSIDNTTTEMLVREDADYAEKVSDLISQYDIGPKKLDFQLVDSDFPYVLTLTDTGVGIWVHQSLGASRTVFIRGEGVELREWAQEVYSSAKSHK